MPEYKGLSSAEAKKLLEKNGYNRLPVKKGSFARKLALWIVSPVSLMLAGVAALSFYSGKLADFWIIVVLYVLNFSISFIHEAKADRSIEKLQQFLAIKTQTLRDGAWRFVDATELVLGDVVELKVGTVVPADVELLEVKNLSINESALSGESVPKEKALGSTAYSGSFVSTGFGVGRVTATGGKTFFGQTVSLIDRSKRLSSLEKDILSISKFISVVSVIIILILSAVLWFVGAPFSDIITLDLSLLIAGVPVALPTVMSLIISVGVFELSKRHAVVRRLSSLEDLADVNLLLSDKTGTLTENIIRAETVVPFEGFNEREVLSLALSASSDPDSNPFDRAVFEKANASGVSGYERTDYIPGDSERKRSTATIVYKGAKVAVSLGTPHIIEGLCDMAPAAKELFEKTVHDAAQGGYRAFAVAVNFSGAEEKHMRAVGMIYLADTIRADARGTIDFMEEHGIRVKMLTGDNYEISSEVARKLGLHGKIFKRNVLDGDLGPLEKDFDAVAGFSEVLPKDKYTIVNLARRNHVVAMTGDGVNDLPAVRTADVGFAVASAVDALKATADIVLLAHGISVIKDAIIESRKIFVRLYNYSVYRISESFRVIVTIAVIGFLYRTYPLTPLHLIVLALLNDVPILSLAFDRVKRLSLPAEVNARKRFILSSLYGLVGVANSLIMFFIMSRVLFLPWAQIETLFFLKLVVSGHLLIYVAHTEEVWFKFLPSSQVILATLATQLLATAFAFWGVFTAPVPLALIGFVWLWSILWMQAAELVKYFRHMYSGSAMAATAVLR